ncbi:MAG: 4a-hydroxytetrahydrobiopterin dehydratase [Planctomycetota bacterium]
MNDLINCDRNVAWVLHHQDHHPDKIINCIRCSVSHTTHLVDGPSINDFTCAARIDALMQ